MMLGSPSEPAPAVLRALVEAPHETSPARGGRLPPALEARYGGPLAIPLRHDRPAIVANFVSTLDGVVSYNTPQAAGGGEISGFFEPDRFVMGLLRALADVVLIGAGTLREGRTEAWTANFIHPDSAGSFATLRRSLGLRRHPLTAVVSGSGALDFEHPGLADPTVEVVVVTTDGGAHRLAGRTPSHVDVRSVGDRIEPRDVLQTLALHGAALVLCEGGPHLFGQLLAADLVDELFLTLAPQVAGRSKGAPRLNLVEDIAFDAATARWARLVELRQAGDHLFSRYRFSA